jgi:RHS repeat-associated protein
MKSKNTKSRAAHNQSAVQSSHGRRAAKNRRLVPAIVGSLALLLVLTAVPGSAPAQSNFEHTKDKLDQTLRSNARVNPSTLAMELSIPIAALPGRGGAAMPLVFNYSSKVWELRATGADFGPPNYPAEVRPTYSSRALAGWTTSYAVPGIDSATELYDCNGNATSLLPQMPAGCSQYYYAKKIRVYLPGGTTHELRKDDGLYTTLTGEGDKTGTYYAVDGSRTRLEWGAGGGSATLFLPDGGRYLFNAQQQCYRYLDRHGNKLEYNQTTQAWTDTLGRTLAAPITDQRIANPTEGTQSFYVPGLGTTNREYKLVWKKLSSGALATSEGYAFAYDAVHCDNLLDPRSPRLFENTHVFKACSHLTGYFDPVVLTEIILPNNQKYKFSYNHYGEIVRIDYPTGGYEKFVYGQIRAITWDYTGDQYVAESYAKSNRGVVDRYVGGAGDGTAERRWQYSAGDGTTGDGQSAYQVTTTNPDSTVEKRFLHLPRSRPTGSQIGNYGYETALVGMEKETQMLDSDGVMRSRKLFEWEVTTAGNPAEYGVPERNARLRRQISLVFEPNETGALATMTETIYETPGQAGAPTDEGYFAALNSRETKTYHFVAINAATAQAATPATAAGWFTGQTPATTSVTEYLYDANYMARGFVGMAKTTSLKDVSGTVKAKTEISYDESAYSLPSTGTMPAAAANSWLDPVTELGATVGSKRGLPTTVKSWHDIAGNAFVTTHSFYDQYGNTRKSRDGNGKEAETEYDDDYAFAYPTLVRTPIPDPSGQHGSNAAFTATTDYDYNTGLVTSTTDANGQTTVMSYKDPVSNVADPLLRIRKVTAPNGHQTITVYGAGTTAATRFVKVETQIDETRWKEGYTWFDGLGRTVKTQSVDSSGDVFVETEYDNMGRAKKTTNPYRTGETIYWTENFYDDLGRITKVKTPDNAEVETFYSLATTGAQIGTVVTVEDQANKQRRSITNALGQLTRVDESLETRDAVTGLVTSMTLGAIDNPAQPTYYGYNTLGKMVKVAQGAQNRFFMYDSLGRLLRVRQPEQQINVALNTSGNPDNNNWTAGFSYDNNGNILTATDAKNVTMTYAYDALNRVKTRSYSDGVTPAVSYYYDGIYHNALNQPQTATGSVKGKLTSVSSSVSRTNYTAFDAMGRTTQSQQITNAQTYNFGYAYNLSGALIEETYPSGRVVKNVLDADGQLSIVQSKKTSSAGYWNYASHFTYTAAGAVSAMQLGNGRWETAKFNERLQTKELGLGKTSGDAELWKVVYEYGELNPATGALDVAKNTGNVARQTLTVGGMTNPVAQSYYYDALDRLTDAKETSGAQQTWSQTIRYDRYGNRTSFNQTVGTQQMTTTPAVDANTNRFTTGQGYSYDLNGNLLADADGRQFTFNGDNKQTQVKDSLQRLVGEYFYDGDGKRVKKKVYDAPTGQVTDETVFVYSGGKLAAEYSTQPPPTPGTVSYTTVDNLGSPRVITDANGNVISRRDFMPFGEEINASVGGRSSKPEYTTDDNVRQKFTTYQRDEETQLDFAEARYYNNSHGRFTAVDPLLASGKSANPQTFNRYVYVRNNPLNLVDPSGLSSCPVGQIASNNGTCIVSTGTRDVNCFVEGCGSLGNVTTTATFPEQDLNLAATTTTLGMDLILRQTIPLTGFQAAGLAGLAYVGIESTARQLDPNLVTPYDAGAMAGNYVTGVVAATLGPAVPASDEVGAPAIPTTTTDDPPRPPAMTDLFRAVNPAELQDITSSGGRFRNPPGIEVKYFSRTAAGAISYAQQTFGTGLYEGPYTLVGTQIPSNLIEGSRSFYSIKIDI